jgi:glutamate synthase (NADPH/NADH) large chain
MRAGPPAQGLYDGQHEHDACGVAFVADMHGRRSNGIVRDALTALHNLDHRGASGAEVNTGDGAGILLQVPDEFLRGVSGLDLPKAGSYAVGLAFLPDDDAGAADAVAAVERLAVEEELRVIGWRDVPTDPSDLGSTALSVMPRFR